MDVNKEAAKKIEIHIEEEEPRRRRKLSGPLGWAARLVAIALPVYAFLYIMNLFTPLGLNMFSGTYNALFLAAVLTLLFLLVPATPSAPRTRVPWYDLVLIGMSIVGTVYIAITYEALLNAGGVGISPMQQLLGLFTIIALMEAVRRTVGWAMIVVVLFFLIHAKFTYLFPSILHGPQFSTGRVMNYLYLSNQGIFGMVLGIATTIIVSFMIFGAFLDASGAGNTFMKLSLALLGHVRGGAAKVAVLGSALFGTVTGSPIAEIGVVGSFTIPLMKRIGYSPTFAGAVEAAAACGGVIDPPVMGAVAFVMADFTGIGYGKIAIAAILPAVLYYLSIFFQLDLRAASTGLVGLPRAELPKVKDALKESWLLVLPIAVLVIWMMVLDEEPTTSVFIALAALITTDDVQSPKSNHPLEGDQVAGKRRHQHDRRDPHLRPGRHYRGLDHTDGIGHQSFEPSGYAFGRQPADVIDFDRRSHIHHGHGGCGHSELHPDGHPGGSGHGADGRAGPCGALLYLLRRGIHVYHASLCACGLCCGGGGRR